METVQYTYFHTEEKLDDKNEIKTNQQKSFGFYKIVVFLILLFLILETVLCFIKKKNEKKIVKTNLQEKEEKFKGKRGDNSFVFCPSLLIQGQVNK